MYNITSDIDQATRDCVNFFSDQVPYALSIALNDTAFAVRKQIVEVTFNRDFTVRNTTFPKLLWRVDEKANKKKLQSAVNQQTVGGKFHDYLERATTGGTKTPRGANIAVPISPASVRGAKGAVRKAEKPRNLKNSYIRNVNGSLILFERKRGKESVAKYVLQKSAKIQPIFRFYEDAETAAVDGFTDAFQRSMVKAIQSSRFFP